MAAWLLSPGGCCFSPPSIYIQICTQESLMAHGAQVYAILGDLPPVMGFRARCSSQRIRSWACAGEPVSLSVPLSSYVICLLATLALRPPSAPVSAFHDNIVQASEQAREGGWGRREDLFK